MSTTRMAVASRVGLLESMAAAGSRLASGFVVGRDVNYPISLNRAVPHTVSRPYINYSCNVHIPLCKFSDALIFRANCGRMCIGSSQLNGSVSGGKSRKTKQFN